MQGRHSNAIDQIIGRNIQLLRLQRKMSQTELARGIGVTFQQVQKYERGSNRVGAGRLLNIAATLGVPVNMLFNGVDHPQTDDAAPSPTALLADPYALRLAQAFSGLKQRNLRRSVVELVELLNALHQTAAPSQPHSQTSRPSARRRVPVSAR